MPYLKAPPPVESLASQAMRWPTSTLQNAWEQALEGIHRATNHMQILHYVSTATGFVWALQVGYVVTYDEATAMNTAIRDAERAAYQRLVEGGR